MSLLVSSVFSLLAADIAKKYDSQAHLLELVTLLQAALSSKNGSLFLV
jgi:hypothetical protein